ncbi:unnamed protein product [Heterosigma akashiwo]|mmetsp:Transcript_10854/g.15176  ORF Transcript_10854/g.15176 Transcript_10854/m.15176 type:complete len:103 (+) Transcript_10854:150-458(+)
MNPITKWIYGSMESAEDRDERLLNHMAEYQERKDELKKVWETPLKADGFWRDAHRYQGFNRIGYKPVYIATSANILDKSSRANCFEAGIAYCEKEIAKKQEN